MKYTKMLSIILYGISLILFIIYFFVEFSIVFDFSRFEKLIVLCLSCIFLYFGGFFMSKYKENNYPMKVNLYLFFFSFLLFFLSLVFFDQESNRVLNFLIISSKEQIDFYFSNKVNLLPLNTIINYIKNYNELLDSGVLITNIYGNFIVCMPFAFFLPMLFQKQNKFRNFLITMILIILSVEVVQLLTLSGSFDIDDFILNVSGALIMYGIMKIQSVQNLLKNIFLLSKIKINKKTIMKVIIFSFIGLILSLLLIQQIAKHYYYNYEEHNRIHNPNITFEYSDVCSNNNVFYEDETHKYYFECYDIDNFYVIVNEKEKYSVKNFVDNSDYIYDIDRVVQRMDYYNIVYFKEHKYSYYEMKVETNNRTYNMTKKIDNEYINVIVKELESEDSKISIFELNFIPLKAGNTIIEFEFTIFDDEGNVVEEIIKKVEIIISKDLKLTYNT